MAADDIFLSYNREDADRAALFAKGFEAAGFSVWWDVTLRSGEAYDQVTESALRSARAVVVLWSPRSVASRWVRAEATLADRNRTLAPVMIEDCDRPIMFELTQTADLRHWRGDATDAAWLSFIDDLQGFLGPRERETAPATAPQAEATRSNPTVLVLPFINRSGEVEQEFFSDGISEDIITELGHLPGLDVVSRNTAFTLKGKIATSAEIAANLDVSHILEGSVRKVGERVRITAQLLDARADTALWTERYDRDLADIFALQDEIAIAVAGALKLALLTGAARPAKRRENDSPEAYELYLLARQFERTGSERMKPSIVRLCERAVQIDPNFARAFALMAHAKVELNQRMVPGYSFEAALADARKAVELAPHLPEAHAALADTLLRGSLFEEAFAPTDMALSMDPDCYEANVAAGYIALGDKRYEDAICYFEKAVELDPKAYRPAGMVVQAYDAIGDDAATRKAAKRVIDICERILEHEPDHGGALGFMVSSLNEVGEVERARQLAKRAQILDPDNARLIYNIACGFALIDGDFTCELLERIAPNINRGWAKWILVDNDLDSLRETPRFRAIMDDFKTRFDLEG